ncbi:MAG TPA: hypothetical protein VJ826_04135 [Candidatus Polarisedimenticolaceae bacterium]|nr:hypothetical protein [Candidatus Polarisedimenticolaceae bacterium]
MAWRQRNRALSQAGQLATLDEPVVVGDPNAVQHRTTFTYEGGDLVALEVQTITDPGGGVTTFTYDRNGNLKTVEDARQRGTAAPKVTQYVYDAMDRLRTRRDPLGRDETFLYDENGNLEQYTDRRGLRTDVSYDPLDRPTFAGFGPGNYTFFSTPTTARTGSPPRPTRPGAAHPSVRRRQPPPL